MGVSVTVRYVNAVELSVPVQSWPTLRADGMDWVDLIADDGTASRVQGCSVYWLYEEDGGWVVGGGTVGHAEISEVVVPGHQPRRPRHMPDLRHEQVKLGWWLPEGES